jgi:hypothetical protein
LFLTHKYLRETWFAEFACVSPEDINILMITVAGKKMVLPIYCKVLHHKRASNLTKQKAEFDLY